MDACVVYGIHMRLYSVIGSPLRLSAGSQLHGMHDAKRASQLSLPPSLPHRCLLSSPLPPLQQQLNANSCTITVLNCNGSLPIDFSFSRQSFTRLSSPHRSQSRRSQRSRLMTVCEKTVESAYRCKRHYITKDLHIELCIRVCACSQTHTHKRKYTNTNTSSCTNTRLHSQTHTNTHAVPHARTHAHMHIYTYVCTHMHARTYALTHTYTNARIHKYRGVQISRNRTLGAEKVNEDAGDI